MVKKRELTAEKWAKAIEFDTELLKKDVGEFLSMHEMLGHRVEDILFEVQMANEWKRSGLQVYEFDPDFAESILNEKWADLLPKCIKHRPHDCFYMKLPCEKLNEGVLVFIVPIEHVMNFDKELFPGIEDGEGVYFGGMPGYEARAVVNTGDGIYIICAFAVSKTLELMFDDTPIKNYPVDLVANGVAYICSENADISKSYVPDRTLRRNNAKRRSSATWSEVGYRIGADLRSYERSSSGVSRKLGGTVRPHMRRAHWHHFWTGPRDGDRRLVLKWLPPIIVASKNGKIEATGHKVR